MLLPTRESSGSLCSLGEVADLESEASVPLIYATHTKHMFVQKEYISGLVLFAVTGASGMALSANLGSFTQSILGLDRASEFPALRAWVVSLFCIASCCGRFFFPFLSDLLPIRRGYLLIASPIIGIAGTLALL